MGRATKEAVARTELCVSVDDAVVNLEKCLLCIFVATRVMSTLSF